MASIFLTQCYSAEFFPHPEYPGRRSSNVNATRFDRFCPRVDEVAYLGKLVIRNFHGNFDDPGFKNYIQDEMENRGAVYSCLARYQIKKQDSYQVSVSNPSAPAAGDSTTYQRGVGIATIEMYSKVP